MQLSPLLQTLFLTLEVQKHKYLLFYEELISLFHHSEEANFSFSLPNQIF